jgi:hypothetical protein
MRHLIVVALLASVACSQSSVAPDQGDASACQHLPGSAVACAATYAEQLGARCRGGFGDGVAHAGSCGDFQVWSCISVPGWTCNYDQSGKIVGWSRCDDVPVHCGGYCESGGTLEPETCHTYDLPIVSSDDAGADGG